MDLQNIDQRVEEIRRLSIHEKSRKQYNSANTQFIIYLMSENPPLITTALQEKVVGKSTDEIKKIIGNDLQNRSPAPIVFEQLEPKYFIQWLLSLRKGNGEEPGIGLFKSHRSALKHLFEEFNAVQSPLFVKELKQLFKGVTKQKVRRIGQGHGKVKEGKDPLPFKMYTMMAKHLLHSVEKEFVFARCFLTVCWNLMCRAGNMSSVCYSHMDWCSSAQIASYVKKYFPSIPHHLKEVGNFALASVVYQSQFLIDELPPNHPLFSTQLFIDVEELETMRENVRCTVPGINVSDARVTGVPPHVATLCHIKALTRQINCSTRMLSSELVDCANDVLDGVIKELEDRAIGAGIVTNAGLVDKLKEAINSTGIQRLVEHVESGATIGTNGSNAGNEGDVYMDNMSTFLINGAVSIVPEGFKLKRCGVRDVWLLWCCGSQHMGHPPYRFILPTHIPGKTERKRLCDLRWIMRRIEKEYLKHSNNTKMPEKISPQLAMDIFEQCEDVVRLPNETQKNRKRRTTQLSWVTNVNCLRKLG